MRVAITGACGNVGSRVSVALAKAGHHVRATDVPKADTSVLPEGVEFIPGDVRDKANVAKVVDGVDVVVHLAAIIPPLSETSPKMSREVNVDATRNVVEAIAAQPEPPALIFTSSVSVHGAPEGDELAGVDSPIVPCDNYSGHKAECEDIIAQGCDRALVFRVGAAVDAQFAANMGISRLGQAFDISPDSRMEVIHPADLATAIVHAIERDDVWGKTLMMGGGAACRIRHRDMIDAFMEAVGIGKVPDSVFSDHVLYTPWMDSDPTEELLHYRSYTWDMMRDEIAETMKKYRPAVRLTKPVARLVVLAVSPHWRGAELDRLRRLRK